MKKPLISITVLVAVLQACSGKPAGFQGDTASTSNTATSGDATGRSQGNRDAESGDAVGMPGDSADGIEAQIVDSENIEMEASNIFEGSDATISVPGSSSNSSSNSNSSNSSSNSSNSSSSNIPTPVAPIPTSSPAAPLTLTITVPSTSLRSGSSPMQALAKLSGQTAPASVTWTVHSNGSQNPGTIDDYGLYTAPASGGGYDVTISATLNDDSSIKATVAIKIVVPEQIFVGCQQGSEFFPITADVYQLPVNTAKLPDFSTIGAKLTTVCMDQYNVAARDWSAGFPGVTGLFEWFALRTTTHIVVPADGSYAFKLNSDDGAKLYIDGRLVIDNDGQHAPTAKEATTTLTAGDHVLAIDYFQGPRYQIALELYWKIPGASAYSYVPKASFK